MTNELAHYPAASSNGQFCSYDGKTWPCPDAAMSVATFVGSLLSAVTLQRTIELALGGAITHKELVGDSTIVLDLDNHTTVRMDFEVYPSEVKP